MNNGIERSDELFDNNMPHRQLLSVQIANCLERVTGFNFAPRVVLDEQGRRLGILLRQKLACIQVEATSMFAGSKTDAEQIALGWLVGDGAAQRILCLEAFVRNGAFRIEREADFVFLTVEIPDVI